MGLLCDLAPQRLTALVTLRGRTVTVRALRLGEIAALVEGHPTLGPVLWDLDLRELRRCPAAALAALLAAACDTTDEDAAGARLSPWEERRLVTALLDLSYGQPAEGDAPGEPGGAAADSAASRPGPSSPPAAGASASTPPA